MVLWVMALGHVGTTQGGGGCSALGSFAALCDQFCHRGQELCGAHGGGALIADRLSNRACYWPELLRCLGYPPALYLAGLFLDFSGRAGVGVGL